jgi:uncharacterized protein (DUF2141 family)
MIKYFFYILSTIIAYQFFTSCASPSSPTGGPKDTIPPTLIHSIPLNQTINFKEQTITLEFDERIKADKIKEQLIITPLIESEYEFTIKKNTFKITFNEPFKDSTTYTLNFREAIQDLTEGNPTNNNKFTFSTGSYIDSLSITGYVKDLLTYDTLKNITIGLYNTPDTITIFNGSPYYFTEVDEHGKYLIENIKNGKYLLYAFSDDNKNLKLETNKESYGFVKDTILLDTGLIVKNVDLIHLDLSPFKKMTALASGKYFEINFNKYILDYEITPVNSNHPLLTNRAKENKAIRVYNNFDSIDSLQIAFVARDSINSIVQDTVFAKFSQSRRKTDDLTVQITPKDRSAIPPSFAAQLTFNKPIITYNLDSIFIQYDTTKISNIHDSTFVWSKNNDILNFDVHIDKILIDTLIAQKQRMITAQSDSAIKQKEQIPLKKQMSSKEKQEAPKINQGLQLYFGTEAFTTADNDTSKAMGYSYKFIDPTNYGIQNISVQTSYTSYTIQLLKENYEIVQEVKNQNNFSFNTIEPGKYKIRVLIDANEDGVWSPGNMLEQIEPEPVYIYPDVLVIRADWQTSLTLTF